MNEAPGGLPSLTEPQSSARPRGGVRSTLALVFSVLSLAASGYLFWQMEKPAAVIAPLMREGNHQAPDVAEIERKFDGQRTLDEQRGKEIEQLKEEIAVLRKGQEDAQAHPKDTPSAETLSALTGSFQQRFADLEARSGAMAKTLEARSLRHATLLAAMLHNEAISRNIKDGVSPAPAIAALEQTLKDLPEAQEALAKLKVVTDVPQLSDAALRAGLRALAPDFMAREKMDAAEGPLEKIAAQLQKLIVVRPREGVMKVQEGVAGLLARIDTLIAASAYSDAAKIVDELGAMAVKDFPSWKESFERRLHAEKAAAFMRDVLLTALTQGVSVPASDRKEAPDIRQERAIEKQ